MFVTDAGLLSSGLTDVLAAFWATETLGVEVDVLLIFSPDS